MTRSRFRWLFALLALLALPWALGATSPPDEPRPTAGPGDSTVLAWLRDEGQSAITASEGSGLTPEQLAAVAWTQPTRMATWTDGFLDGQPGAPPVEDLDVWFAPLVLDGRAAGVLEARVEDGTVMGHRELWDPAFGAAILSYPADRFVLEEDDVVFRLSGEWVSPVGADATELLAGRIQVGDFQPFLASRLIPDEVPEAGDEGEPSLAPVLGAALLLGGILAIAALLAWSRRPEGT